MKEIILKHPYLSFFTLLALLQFLGHIILSIIEFFEFCLTKDKIN